MYFVVGLWMIVLGILAVPSLLLSRRPDAKEMLDKITPYQGWIGVISVFWGLWTVIYSIMHMELLNLGFKYSLFWFVGLATGAGMIILGFMLGIGVLKQFIKDEDAQAKMDETLAKLQPKQGSLGVAAIVLGVVLIVLRVII